MPLTQSDCLMTWTLNFIVRLRVKALFGQEGRKHTQTQKTHTHKTHTHTRTRTHARTHARTHTHALVFDGLQGLSIGIMVLYSTNRMCYCSTPTLLSPPQKLTLYDS